MNPSFDIIAFCDWQDIEEWMTNSDCAVTAEEWMANYGDFQWMMFRTEDL